MLESLRTVRGAVSTERLVPVLSHFAFRDGRVCGFNGRVFISAPAPEVELNVTVPARPLLTAYDAMAADGDTSDVTLTLLEDGRLRISKKRQRVTLPAGPVEAFPFADPTRTKRQRVPKGLLALFERLRPFVGDDASRPWSASVKLQGAVAYATNNIVLVQARTPDKCPLLTAVLPVQAIDELLRIGQEPTHMTVERDACTFYLPGDAWLRTVLLHDAWPDAAGVLKAAHAGAKLIAHATGQWAQAVEAVRPFCPDPKHEVVVMEGAEIRTLEGDTSASVEGFKFPAAYSFHVAPLLATLHAASHLSFAPYPRVPWRNTDGMLGVTLGLAT